MKINYQYQTKKRIYELTDHLGNVRAVIKREKDADDRAQIIKASDYYPFGMEMPGRKYASEAYRYDYQGQYAEKDGETGLHSFEARLWDARIARWNSTDPYGQYFSRYMGMGNNPVMSVDPDGEWVKGDSFWDAPGKNTWNTYADKVGKIDVTKIRINNVRIDKINAYVQKNLSNFRYKALSSSCVTEASNSLLGVGVLNIPFLRHPSLLQLQIFARQNAYYTSFINY